MLCDCEDGVPKREPDKDERENVQAVNRVHRVGELLTGASPVKPLGLLSREDVAALARG